MRNKTRFGPALIIVVGVALVFLAPGFAGAQTPRAAAKTWDIPRTPDGQPNIQSS